MTTNYPAFERIRDKGMPVEGSQILLGYEELAKLWGIKTATARTLYRDTQRYGEWRYVPQPDGWLIRTDDSALPLWFHDTIVNFDRLETINGKGNHTRGAERAGYRQGAHTYAYRHGLGVAGAEELRKEYREQLANGGAVLEALAEKYELRVDEVKDVIDGKRWITGTGKSRGKLPEPVAS